MSNDPALDGRQVIRILESFDFEVFRTVGSHHVLWKEGHPYNVTVPVHGRRPLPRGTLASIIRRAGLTRAKFFERYQEL